MEIMKVLFDQEVVTRSLLEAKFDEGIKEGRNEGIKEGRNEGIKEGRDEGRNEEKADVVRRGRLSGLSDDVLMGITGLSHEDMMKIH